MQFVISAAPITDRQFHPHKEIGDLGNDVSERQTSFRLELSNLREIV